MLVVRRLPTAGYLDTHLWVPKHFINVEQVKHALTHTYIDPNADNKVRTVQLWHEAQHHLQVPRHLWRLGDLPFPILDCRPNPLQTSASTSRILLDHTVRGGQLVPTGGTVQQDSITALGENPSGILQLACGKGKTVVALHHIHLRGGPGIVVLPDTQLLEQWSEELALWLDLPGGVGRVQSDVMDWRGRDVVLATYHTIGKLAQQSDKQFPDREQFRRYFTTAIWDEGHHISAPTFAPGAEFFYFYRLALTATPKRLDGMHVIYNMHIGPVVHKDLRQDLRARIAFYWSGHELDLNDPECDVVDVKGELHQSKIASYQGKWREHLNLVLKLTWDAVQNKRKVLVICNAVAEAVNLCALWNGMTELYTDIQMPTPQDVGETLSPLKLGMEQRKARKAMLENAEATLAELPELPAWAPRTVVEAQQLQELKKQREQLEDVITECRQVLAQCDVHAKIIKLYNRKRRDFLERLRASGGTAGLMIYDVDKKQSRRDLERLPVMFVISKYGREGLNNKALDTVISTMPFSSENTVQQVKGRIERDCEGKHEPVLLILVHDIGPFIGMSQKLQKHLREWPLEEGGPLEYELHNYPKVKATWKSLFGS